MFLVRLFSSGHFIQNVVSTQTWNSTCNQSGAKILRCFGLDFGLSRWLWLFVASLCLYTPLTLNAQSTLIQVIRPCATSVKVLVVVGSSLQMPALGLALWAGCSVMTTRWICQTPTMVSLCTPFWLFLVSACIMVPARVGAATTYANMVFAAGHSFLFKYTLHPYQPWWRSLATQPLTHGGMVWCTCVSLVVSQDLGMINLIRRSIDMQNGDSRLARNCTS